MCKSRILAFVVKTDAMNIEVKAIEFTPASPPVKCLQKYSFSLFVTEDV